MEAEILNQLMQLRPTGQRDSSPPSQIPISPGNDGIKNLEALAKLMQGQDQNPDDPIVLVPGFSGWGRPLFGTINYWGGFESLPEILASAGYKVIVVKIGPVSSNWERACEIWTQLTNINKNDDTTDRGFDLPNTKPPRKIPIDYGELHPAKPLGYLEEAKTWRPVVFGDIPNGWKWGEENPVHFICHSQGGTTVRFLIEMLRGTHKDKFPGPHLHPDFSAEKEHQDWVKSVVTIGTPHKGTTVTDVVQDLLPPNYLEVLTRSIWSLSVDDADVRFYDLQLDHWGFYKKENESLSAMYTRILPLVERWWNSNHHGLNDNSIPGVASLSDFAPNPSEHTYYFTMSFCATDPFPNDTLDRQDINEFLALYPINEVVNPFGWLGTHLATVFQVFSRTPSLPRLQDFAGWFTDVANRHLGRMGFFSSIPRGGSQIPRADMLPVIALPAYAMGGYQLDDERLRILAGITTEEYQRNDGIVNTRSMSGPIDAIYGAGTFPGTGIDMANMTRAKKKYWHLGENVTMDHADQIGVFTSENTVMEVNSMYLLFAYVVTRLQ